MNRYLYPLLLVALLAGCSSTPSQEAAIEDRGVQAEALKTGGDAQIVDLGAQGADKAGTAAVATSSMTPEVAVSEAHGVPPEAVSTTGSVPQSMTVKSGQNPSAVQTRGLAETSSNVKTMGTAPATATTVALVDVTGSKVADAKPDTTMLPAPDAATPSWGDLKNPQSPLSQRRLQFDYDSTAIRDDYRTMLETHSQFLKANKEAKVILQGNTDERGSREYNLALGQRRAESVFKALSLLGAPEAQMEAVSMGEEKPIAEGHDEAAWQQNRRVEILYQGE
jgi:peptidoglycan-associated lipoprotein